jgi:hypothetical protein
MYLHRQVSLRQEQCPHGVIEDIPVDVCFEENRLALRLVYNTNASFMLLKRISRILDTFVAKFRRGWSLWSNTAVDEGEKAKTHNPVGTPCYFVIIQPKYVSF